MRKMAHTSVIRRMCTICLACIMALSSSRAVALNLETEKMNGLDTGMAILENINAETKRGATHISRWNERESDLNTLVFENEDATVTSYFFAEPIKYVDENGKIRDKSNVLSRLITTTKNPYAYVNKENDIKTYFPATLSDQSGVLLTYENVEIEMFPQTKRESAARKQMDSREYTSKDYVYYEGVFGENTALRYSATFSGVKEDIVLYSNTENEFSFIVKTHGLSAEGNSASVVFRNTSGEVVAEIAGLFAYDSAITPSTTDNISMELVTKNENEEYVLTLYVDETFINSPKTQYPVYIDPSVTIRPAGSGTTKTIQDASVFMGAQSSAYGGEQYIYIGNSTNLVANRGVARTLMKFPGLITHSELGDIDASRIVDAELHLYECSGKTTAATLVGAFYTGSTWSEATVCLNNNMSWGATGSTLFSQSITGTNRWVTLNLMGAISSWKSSTLSADKGMLLRNAAESTAANCLKFNSTENSQNKPYVTVTWGKFTVNHYLDQGYRTRFSSAATAVAGHQAVVSDILDELFGLTVVSNVYSFTSYADDCRISADGGVTASNLANPCNHSTDHLTTAKLRSDLVSYYGAGNETMTRVLWTGHILTGDPSSNSVTSNHSVIMTSREVTDHENNYVNESATKVNIESRFDLLHELSHQLGAPDHYCYNDKGTAHCSNENCRKCNGLSQLVCVMTSRKDIEGISTASLYCNLCKNTVQNHVDAHH